MPLAFLPILVNQSKGRRREGEQIEERDQARAKECVVSTIYQTNERRQLDCVKGLILIQGRLGNRTRHFKKKRRERNGGEIVEGDANATIIY